ncbi:MAG TPA: hypothetical protein DEQ14_11645 [Treponema sp.]|nr:hypothetical protein [Treponema sp.]
MKKIFRPVDFWKSAIMTLPDASFFELVRSVFGKIKTPFNKQILLENLAAFLQRPEIRRNISAYIDEDDAKIIAAVAALGEPAPGEMESFFSGEFSYVRLHDLIVNLEERFILYRFRDEDSGRLALNPVLKTILAPFAAGTPLLFPSTPAPEKKSAAAPPACDDRVLAGIISFVRDEKIFFKAEGEFRKKISELSEDIFPGIDIHALIRGLQVLGILRQEGDALFPDLSKIYGFGQLSERERLEYLAAGICCFIKYSLSPADISPYLYRRRVKSLGSFIHRIVDEMETERLYPPQTIGRIAGILARDFSGGEEIDSATIVTAMEKAGLLVRYPPDNFRLRYATKIADNDPAAGNCAEEKQATPHIAMDTAFSCVVYPGISYSDLMSLALMLSVRETGTAARFELTRDSAIRAFDCGFSARTMLDLLTRLSGGRIDKNMAWTLADWEKRYNEVSLFKGLVLCLSPERRYLAETKPLAGLITATLAPGVFLLDETAGQSAEAVLQKAGVDIFAGQARAGGTKWTAAELDANGSPPGKLPFAPLAQNSSPAQSGGDAPPAVLAISSPETPDSQALPEASALIDGFHSFLEKARFSKEERDELFARIDRRLVLCEAQLQDAAVRYEKLEARGLDYAGKAMIAKQAIALKSPLEIFWTGRTGADHVTGIPVVIEKSGGESALVITPLERDGEGGTEELRIPLGKISLLRRIKKSIFEHDPGMTGRSSH